MENKKNFNKIFSAQIDVEPILAQNEAIDFNADDFILATDAEKESFIEMRKSMSYWQDAWRRLKKNQVAMVALYIIIAIILFAFVGPFLSQYEYSQQIRGSENIAPGLGASFWNGQLRQGYPCSDHVWNASIYDHRSSSKSYCFSNRLHIRRDIRIHRRKSR